MTLQPAAGFPASTPARSAESAPQATIPLAPGIPVHRAEDLTRGGQLANIVLDGKVYSLRITRAGKLILTK